MQTTQNLNLKKPDGTEPVDIQDLNDNADILDAEVAKKLNSSGGDISETTIKTLDAISTEFPIPAAGEKPKTFLAKIKKNMEDWKAFKDGIITVGRLMNNGSTTASGYALDARYGKTLYDLYAQLNSNLKTINGKVINNEIRTSSSYPNTTMIYYSNNGIPEAHFRLNINGNTCYDLMITQTEISAWKIVNGSTISHKQIVTF